MASTLHFHVPNDADSSALEQELVGRGRRVLRDDRLSGHSLNHVKRRVELVDNLVEAVILDLLAREGVGPQPVAVPDVRGKADALRLRLEQLEDKYADGDLPRAGYLRNRDRLTAMLTDLQRAEALARIPGPTDGVTAENWSALPLERRRAVVAHKVAVRLLPSGGNPHFNPELIKITPKP